MLRKSRVKLAVLSTIILSTVLLQTGYAKDPKANYSASVEQWRQQSARTLTSEYGVLSAIGLYWLRAGENRFGSNPTNEVLLPSDVVPPQAGVVKVANDRVSLEANGTVPVTLGGKPVRKEAWTADGGGKTPSVAIGRLKLELLNREQGKAVRVYDPNSPLRRDFTGQQWYAVDDGWVVEGRFIPFAVPKKLEYEIAIGGTRSALSPGVVSFKRDGKEYRFEVQESGKSDYVAFFFDATTGKDTYGGGRVVPITKLGNDRVSLDFNKAYNMPCAVSPYFGCEIAPRQNHLVLAIPAGEKKPARKILRVASSPDYIK